MKNLNVSKLVKAGVFTLALGMSASVSMASNLEEGLGLEILQNGPITDEELKLYIAVTDSINSMKEQASARIIEIVNEEELDPKAYNELSRVDRSGVMTAEAEGISEEEKAKYQRVKQRTTELQTELNKKAGEAVKNSGLAIAKFNEIQKAVASNPEVKERMSNLAASANQQGQGTGMGASSAEDSTGTEDSVRTEK
jgi:hypothetical protein